MTRAIVKDLNDPLNPGYMFFMDTSELKNAIARTSSYTVRVGDDPLASHIGVCIKELYAATRETNGDTKLLRDAHSHLEQAQLRIGELLHTNTPVDLGIVRPNWKRWLRRSR
jgi:hypothetical protein